MKQIVIAINYVDYKDVRRKTAQDVALRVIGMRPMQQVSSIAFDFFDAVEPSILNECNIYHFPTLRKDSSKLLNNNRRMPYIKEILDTCNKVQCDVFGYINSDILVSNRVYDILQSDFDSYIFSRTDIGEVDAEDFVNGKIKPIYGGDSHCGADGFFFNKSWWNSNKDRFPDDLVLGETEWDTCYRKIIRSSGCKYLESRELYHVYHDAKWNVNSQAGINNKRILKEI